jgi:hypothetical protein
MANQHGIPIVLEVVLEKVARARLRFFANNYPQLRLPEGQYYVQTYVRIVEETPDSFTVEFSARFRKAHPDLCASTFSKYAGPSTIYTTFTATDELPTIETVRHAMFSRFTLVKRSDGFDHHTFTTDVLVVDETDTQYRLRFPAKFAKNHPGMCQEWVGKEVSDPNVRLKEFAGDEQRVA